MFIAGLSACVSFVVVFLVVLSACMCRQQRRAVRAKQKLTDKISGCEETVVRCLMALHDVPLTPV